MLWLFHHSTTRKAAAFALGISGSKLDRHIWPCLKALAASLRPMSFDDRYFPNTVVEIPKTAIDDLGQLKKLTSAFSEAVFARAVGDGVDIWIPCPVTKGSDAIRSRFGKKGRFAIRFVLVVHIETGEPVACSKLELGRVSEINLSRRMDSTRGALSSRASPGESRAASPPTCRSARGAERSTTASIRDHPALASSPRETRGSSCCIAARVHTLSPYRILVEKVIGRLKWRVPRTPLLEVR